MNYTYQDATHKHAVTHLNGVPKFNYDANGNMTSRTEDSATYTQAYDSENRLQSVITGGQTTTYTYDADSALVKKVQGGQTTVYVGQHFEKNLSTGQATSYYALGGQRVALKKAGMLYYLLADHLGSTSVVTNQSGGIVAQQLYKPWGEPRWSSGTLPTDRKFTGQRSEEATLGSLYGFQARAYSPRLGRFLSSDTIVPEPGGHQSLNRYAYVGISGLGGTARKIATIAAGSARRERPRRLNLGTLSRFCIAKAAHLIAQKPRIPPEAGEPHYYSVRQRCLQSKI